MSTQAEDNLHQEKIRDFYVLLEPKQSLRISELLQEENANQNIQVLIQHLKYEQQKANPDVGLCNLIKAKLGI